MVGVSVGNLLDALELDLHRDGRIFLMELLIGLDRPILLRCARREVGVGFLLELVLLDGIELDASCVLDELADEIPYLGFLRCIVLRDERARFLNLACTLVHCHDVRDDLRLQ